MFGDRDWGIDASPGPCHQVIAKTRCLVTETGLLTGHQVIAMTGCLVAKTGVLTRDGVSTIQMYSSTSTITLNMHEYK